MKKWAILRSYKHRLSTLFSDCDFILKFPFFYTIIAVFVFSDVRTTCHNQISFFRSSWKSEIFFQFYMAFWDFFEPSKHTEFCSLRLSRKTEISSWVVMAHRVFFFLHNKISFSDCQDILRFLCSDRHGTISFFRDAKATEFSYFRTSWHTQILIFGMSWRTEVSFSEHHSTVSFLLPDPQVFLSFKTSKYIQIIFFFRLSWNSEIFADYLGLEQFFKLSKNIYFWFLKLSWNTDISFWVVIA